METQTVKKDERIPLEDTEQYLRESAEEALREKEFYEKKLSLFPLLKELAERRERGERITEREARMAMAITCYGNIAYCCGISKKCPFRDAALRALGISHSDYKKMKERKAMEMLRELGVIGEGDPLPL